MQVTFLLTSVMRSQIVSVTSPSHVMESTEAGVRVDGGCFVTKTRFSGTAVADLDRPIVVLVEMEESDKPQVPEYYLLIYLIYYLIDEPAKWKTRESCQIHTADSVGMG